MRPRRVARFDLAPVEARADQERTARRALAIERIRRLPRLRLVAGADAAYAAGRVYACVVVLDARTLEVVEEAYAGRPATFPYVPGLLSYREGPAVLDAFARVSRADLVLFDAAGIAHPRRFGLARHLGYLLDVPSIGVAKSVLCGAYREPGWRRGARSWIVDGGERIGVVLRTRADVRPVFVSRGWQVGIADAVSAVLALRSGYRVPEPTRLADLKVEAWKRSR